MGLEEKFLFHISGILISSHVAASVVDVFVNRDLMDISFMQLRNIPGTDKHVFVNGFFPSGSAANCFVMNTQTRDEDCFQKCWLRLFHE